jgi:competence protein ComGC
MYKIIGADGKEYGPVSTEQLRQWLREGRVNSQTQIQPEGASDWQPLSALPEFAAELSPPAATSLPGVAPAGPAKTSGMAITSLVLGILGLFSCGITALFGLILGIIALVKIRNSQGRLSGNGLAIAGIIVSGIFLLMLPLYAAMMLPALAKAKERAQTINCVNNVKQLGLAVRMYATDNNDQFPSAAKWCDAIQSYVQSPKPFQCAADPSQRCAFAYNRKLDGLKLDGIDPQTVLFFESSAGWNAAGGRELFSAHKHSRTRIVVGFADGSVQQLPRSQLETLRWDP